MMKNSPFLYNNEYAAKTYDSSIQSSLNGFFQHLYLFMEKFAQKHGFEGILDVGCGTGTLAVKLAKLGYTVYGIDFSHEMLTIANQKRSELGEDIQKRLIFSHGNMTNFTINRKFSMAMIPGGVFCHLTREEDQIQSLRNIASHLIENGILCMDTMWPSLEIMYSNQNPHEPKRIFVKQYLNDLGNLIEAYDEIFIDYPTQKLLGKKILVENVKETGEKIEHSLPMNLRLTFPSEMRLLFQLCGFEVLHEYSAYDEKPILYPKRITWVVRRK